MKKVVLILAAVVLVGGGAWYFLVADKQEQANARERLRQLEYNAENAAYDARHQVKRVVEPSGPVYNDPKAAEQCRENLKRIESAKRHAATQLSIASGDVPLDAILKAMGVSELPRCPAGGEYRIGPVGTMVRCSIGTNATATHDDDHFIRDY
ncbi:hypothetical protein JW916_07825 [Candidatus Sumerlaeota bacterium]|nr:hypothetical protein [Candidatus Sumerlaeota bacterium]